MGQRARAKAVTEEVKRAGGTSLDALLALLSQAIIGPPCPTPVCDDKHHLQQIRLLSNSLDKIMAEERSMRTSRSPKLPQRKQDIQASTTTTEVDSGAEARFAKLVEWLEQNGARLQGAKITGGLPEGAGVIALEDIKQGSFVASVPLSCMMSTSTAVTDYRILSLLQQDQLLQMVSSLLLVLHLLFEKHAPLGRPGEPGPPQSFWKPYIDALPPHEAAAPAGTEKRRSHRPDFALPLFYSDEALHLLTGTGYLHEIHTHWLDFVRQYVHLLGLLRAMRQDDGQGGLKPLDISWFTFEQYRWAVSVVMSRQNELLIPIVPGDAARRLALIPLFDLFNHEAGDVTSTFDASDMTMSVTAKRDFRAGDQVYICYGPRTNVQLLKYSGFVPRGNPYNAICLPTLVDTGDPLYRNKMATLQALERAGALQGGPPFTRREMLVYGDGRVSPQLATWLRVVATGPDGAARLSDILRDSLTIKPGAGPKPGVSLPPADGASGVIKMVDGGNGSAGNAGGGGGGEGGKNEEVGNAACDHRGGECGHVEGAAPGRAGGDGGTPADVVEWQGSMDELEFLAAKCQSRLENQFARWYVKPGAGGAAAAAAGGGVKAWSGDDEDAVDCAVVAAFCEEEVRTLQRFVDMHARAVARTGAVG
eukprot:jgi/Mesvir1/12351/Mv00534-RA.1